PAPTDRIRTVASLVGEARQAAGHQPGRDAHKGDARRRLSLAQRSPRDVSAGRAARVRCAGQVDAVATGTDQRAAAGLRRDMPMTACRVVVVKDTAALAHAAAELFVKLAAQTASARRPFHVLLAGGRTPKAMYALLASAAYRSRVDWDRVAFFFGDERAVPPDHPQSNYRMDNEVLFRP